MHHPPKPSSTSLGILLDCALYVAVAALLAHWLWQAWMVAWPLPVAVTHPLLIAVLSLPAWLLRQVYLTRVMARRGGVLPSGSAPVAPTRPPDLPPAGAMMSRGRRLQRPGSALRRQLRHGDPARVESLLRQVLPPGVSTTDMAVEAAAELALLLSAARDARASHLAAGLVDLFEGQAGEAARALAKSVDRLAAAAAQNLRSERVEELLAREEEALAGLAAALRVARESLTESMLGERGELEEAQLELRALGQGVRDVMDREGRSRP